MNRTIEPTTEEIPQLDNAIRLTFDEAEALAAALHDLALIVRVQHGVGFAEVA